MRRQAEVIVLALATGVALLFLSFTLATKDPYPFGSGVTSNRGADPSLNGDQSTFMVEDRQDQAAAHDARSVRLVYWRDPAEGAAGSSSKYFAEELYDGRTRYRLRTAPALASLGHHGVHVSTPQRHELYEPMTEDVYYVTLGDPRLAKGIALPGVPTDQGPLSALLFGRGVGHDLAISGHESVRAVASETTEYTCGAPTTRLRVDARDVNPAAGPEDYYDVWLSVPDGVRLRVVHRKDGVELRREQCVELDLGVPVSDAAFTSTIVPGSATIVTTTVVAASADTRAKKQFGNWLQSETSTEGSSDAVVVSREITGETTADLVYRWPVGWMLARDARLLGGRSCQLIVADSVTGPPISKSRRDLVELHGESTNRQDGATAIEIGLDAPTGPAQVDTRFVWETADLRFLLTCPRGVQRAEVSDFAETAIAEISLTRSD